MDLDPVRAQFAQQNIRDAKLRTQSARQKFEEESIRTREGTDRFYGNLALFSSGTIALSVTFLGYLKSTPGRIVLYPRALVATWISLLVCVVAALFCNLVSYYYVHFARLHAYVDSLVEQNETYIQELDNLYVVNLTTPEAKQEQKKRLNDEANRIRADSNWNKRRETFFSALSTGLGWISRVAFPFGLGLLIFFAAKNM